MNGYCNEMASGNAKAYASLGLLLALTACGGSDSSAPEISQRDATNVECATGGTVLLVDGADVATVCNGENGRDGAEGPQGGQGIQGIPGTDGTDGSNGAVGAVGATGAPGGDALTPSSIISTIASRASSVVLLVCSDGVGSFAGSGTKTNSNTLLTAMHVIDGMTTCTVYSEAPVTDLGNVTTFLQHGQADLVELEVAWTPAGAAIDGIAPTLGAQPAIGDLVTVVGHPSLYDGLALELQYTSGFVTATNLSATVANVPALADRAVLWAQAWSTDAVAWHGNSGGPVFDDQGSWIGILVGGFNGDADNTGPDLSVVLPLF